MAEITHLICAHCGGDNILRNYDVSDGTLTTIRIADGLRLMFNCQHCWSEYHLPVREWEASNTNVTGLAPAQEGNHE